MLKLFFRFNCYFWLDFFSFLVQKVTLLEKFFPNDELLVLLSKTVFSKRKKKCEIFSVIFAQIFHKCEGVLSVLKIHFIIKIIISRLKRI